MAVLRYVHGQLPPGADTVALLDQDVATHCGVSLPVYRWALRELEALGVLTYERLSPGRISGRSRDLRIDLNHWVLNALELTGGAK